jgi:head-tail adaptor
MPSAASGGSVGGKHSVNELRIPTTLELAVDAPDDQGGVRRTWQIFQRQVWVGDKIFRAMYFSEGGQLEVQNLHRVTMRYTLGIRGAAKMRFNGQFGIWYIKTVNDPDNQRHWLVCDCTEVAT